MSSGTLANLVLFLHFIYVLAVVLPVPLIPVGARLNWRWVRSLKWRAVHAAMMGFVLIEVLIGMVCPLTWLENQLLEAAGQSGYEQAFVAHWVAQIMYWDAPAWLFGLIYFLFTGLIALLWVKFPPRSGRSIAYD